MQPRLVNTAIFGPWMVVAVVCAATLAVPRGADAQAQAPASAPGPEAHSAQPSAAQPASTPSAGHEAAPADHAAQAGEHASAEEHGESIWGLVARIVNFAILVGALAYFLRDPLARHLTGRSQQIRADLVSARETTERARSQLAAIDRRLKELPTELEALKARGAEEVAAEGVRIRQQAETERHRLLEQTRREIELQVRLAKQSLAEHTADLAVSLAADRITETMTPADHARLIDRYVAHVKEVHG